MSRFDIRIMKPFYKRMPESDKILNTGKKTHSYSGIRASEKLTFDSVKTVLKVNDFSIVWQF